MAKSLVITQEKSSSKLTPIQRANLRALGLSGRGSKVARKDLRGIRGMLNKLHHIISAEQVDGSVDLVAQKKSVSKRGLEIKAAKKK